MRIEEIGDILGFKLLSMLLIVSFALLLFSGHVATLIAANDSVASGMWKTPFARKWSDGKKKLEVLKRLWWMNRMRCGLLAINEMTPVGVGS